MKGAAQVNEAERHSAVAGSAVPVGPRTGAKTVSTPGQRAKGKKVDLQQAAAAAEIEEVQRIYDRLQQQKYDAFAGETTQIRAIAEKKLRSGIYSEHY